MASANGITSNDDHPKSVEQLYYEAYACVDQGICYDEIGLRDGALAMYERGLRLIDEAGRSPGSDQSEMYQKMARAKEHILFRLKDLRSNTEPTSTPTAAEARLPPPARPPPPYESINSALNALGNTKNAEELLEISDGVQIFFIKGEDTTAPSYPTSLKIFKFLQSDAHVAASQACAAVGVDAPPAFLQVGDWIYPLVPGRSPVLHSSYGAYIFPNPSADKPDSFVGVMLPADIERGLIDQFEKYMDEFTVLKTQEAQPDLTPKEKEALSTKIAKYLIAGGEYLAIGIKEGAKKGLTAVSSHSQSIRSKGPKTEKPMTIDPRVQSSVHYLRRGTKIAVKVSGYLVDKVGLLATHLGKSIANSATKRFPKGSTGGSVVHGTVEVLGGGVASIATVWMSLEDASKALAKGIANETVQIVDHKYGESAASVTNDLLYSGGHAATTYMYFDTLGFKGIAKRTAKQAGIHILKDLNKPSTDTTAAGAGGDKIASPSGEPPAKK